MSTFGITSPGATSATNSANGFGGTKATLTEAGTVSKISLNCWCDNTSNTGRIRMAIYTDNAGVPGNLVAVSPEVAFTNAGSTDFNDFVLTTPVALTAGDYWFMIWNGPHTGANSDRRGFNSVVNAFRWVSAGVTYSSTADPPSPCPTTTTASQQTAAFATYSTGSASDTAQPSGLSGQYTLLISGSN